jgi:hypothetical protein
VLANVRKYQEYLKRYYNKCVVQKELNIEDLVLKNDICTKHKHKFSLSWEWPFIIVDIAAPGSYVLAEVDSGMLPNTWNVDQLRKYYAWCIIWLIKIKCFSSYIYQYTTLSFGPLTELAHQYNNKNDKSRKRDDVLPIWLYALPQLSIRQFLIGV